MRFTLTGSGTLTECREKLNKAVHSLPLPETQEHKVIRMIAHHIVADHLDPLHAKWDEDRNAAAAARLPKNQGGMDRPTTPMPDEPTASFSIDCSVTFGA